MLDDEKVEVEEKEGKETKTEEKSEDDIDGEKVKEFFRSEEDKKFLNKEALPETSKTENDTISKEADKSEVVSLKSAVGSEETQEKSEALPEMEVKNKDSKQEQILKEVKEGRRRRRLRQRRLRRMKKVGNIIVNY